VPYVDANGLRFHVQALRDPQRLHDGQAPRPRPRPPVVMVHGLVVDNLSSYYYTIANPVALVADTYLYDLRGHGRSQVPASGYRVADHVADLRALLDAWQVTEPVHLVGTSFGGVVALAFAHLMPDRVASLVLVEAHVATDGWGDHMAGSLALAAFGLHEAGLRDWLDRNGTRKLDRLVRHAERLLLETSLVDDLQGERPLPPEALAGIECPTLAIYGEGSDILAHAHALERHMPRCELHVVERGSHAVLYEATPFVREHTLVWLEQHAAPPWPAAP
jgi:pimeloyl-ACP methyl ester carboxylesterase